MTGAVRSQSWRSSAYATTSQGDNRLASDSPRLATKADSFDYCIQQGKLTLSSEEALLEYEQVFTVDTPAPCQTRSPDQCAHGEGCSLGACEGGDNCASRHYESQCLTTQGCKWNDKTCAGYQDHCALADYGVVPGCDFTDTPTTCMGTPIDCDMAGIDRCKVVRGCQINDLGRCAGPTLDCAGSWRPVGYCTGSSSDCVGVTSCGAFKGQTSCGYTKDYFPDAPCTWESSFCEGTPMPCSSYDQSTCSNVPGCKLGTL